MKVLDPLAEINPAPERKPMRPLETVMGRRVGLLWGRHAGSVKFWPVLEEVIVETFKPAETHRLYKESSWNPAPLPHVEDLATKIDYAIIGVGA